MEQQTDSSAANEGAEPDYEDPATFEISSEDLDELEAIYQSLLLAGAASQRNENPQGLFHIAQRLNHITVRTRKILEDL